MADHPAIVHWKRIENPDPWVYPGETEEMSRTASFAKHFGLLRIGIHHERLIAGARTSLPHAEKTEDEFIYVICGTPDVWLDGHLHRLAPGCGVGFPAGTGLAHTFINNTETEVELLVIGDRTRADNQIIYPLNPERQPRHQDWWEDAPRHALGEHDGLSDRRRAELAKKA